MKLYIGLVHYPVYNKHLQIIASAVTTFDLHDIARAARTYDIKKFFVITPLDDQRELVERVKHHWTEGYGAAYNEKRKEAISLMALAASLEEAIQDVTAREGGRPLLIATDAAVQAEHRSISYKRLRQVLQEGKGVLLLFGTAWGLDKTVMDLADYILYPVTGRSGYQHLSVRAATAIILDRLAGKDFER